MFGAYHRGAGSDVGGEERIFLCDQGESDMDYRVKRRLRGYLREAGRRLAKLLVVFRASSSERWDWDLRRWGRWGEVG